MTLLVQVKMFSLGTAVALFSIASWPQTTTPKPRTVISLPDAIRAADTSFPRIRAAVAQQAAATGQVAVTKTAYLPRLDMLWQTNRATANNVYGLVLPQGVVPAISGPVIPASNTRSAWGSAGGALLSWQPIDFGLRHANVEIARRGAAAAAASTALTRLQVAEATAAAYFDLAAAEQSAAVAQANVRRWQSFSQAVHVLVDNQLRPGADAAQADAELARAQTQWIQAQTVVTVERVTLAELVGKSADQIDINLAPFDSVSPETLPETPLPSHPALVQQTALLQEEKERVAALARSYAPQVSALGAISGRGTGATLNGTFPPGTTGLAPDTMNWAAGVQVTFPAFDFFSLRAQKRVQEANVRSQQESYAQASNDLSVAVRQAQAQLSGAQQVALNSPTELSAARQSETQQKARFRAGLATVVDVAAAEGVLAQAEADDAVAKVNVWRAMAALAAARGDLAPFLNLLGSRR